MKKGDFVIIGVIAAIFVLSLCTMFSFFKTGDRVVIKQDDKILYDKSIDINTSFNTGTNTIVVENGVVYVKDSICKNQICVNTGKISKKGEKVFYCD